MKINITTTKGILIAGAAAIGLAFAAPAATAHDGMNISLDSLELKFGDEDFLESLIAMDADDIAEIRSEMAEARADDIVCIAGKGHEQGQIVGAGTAMRVLPFDDVAVARECAA